MAEDINVILNYLADHLEYQNGMCEFIFNAAYAELVRIHEHREED